MKRIFVLSLILCCVLSMHLSNSQAQTSPVAKPNSMVTAAGGTKEPNHPTNFEQPGAARIAPSDPSAPALSGIGSQIADNNGTIAKPKVSPFAAVEQARKAGVSTCMPIMEDMLGLVVDNGPNSALINWHNGDTNQRLVVAYTFFGNSDGVAPRAIAFAAGSPTANQKCDGVNLRIQSFNLSCEDLSKSLAAQSGMNASQTTANDIRIYPVGATGMQVFLMPAASSGCVLISSGTFYQK